MILILPGGREKYVGNVSCIQTARGTAGPTVPAPKSRFLQVSGQVGTLQAAIRHSLDIQGQCPCLLGIVPRLTWQHPLACYSCTSTTTLADTAVYHVHNVPHSFHLMVHSMLHNHLRSRAATGVQHFCLVSHRLGQGELLPAVRCKWRYEARFSILRRWELACLVPGSIL